MPRDRLQISPSEDFTILRGELTGEDAATAVQALNTVADELFGQWSEDCNRNPELVMPSRPALLAAAFAEICRRALARDVAATSPPRAEVTFVMRADRPDWLVDPLGSSLPANTVPAFMCDPEFYAVMVDSLGLPVDLGRQQQSPTPAQRRAMAVRDGGCTFPGCECPVAWTDAHHADPWGGGGYTNVATMALLCRRHHRVAHRRFWAMTVTGDGWTVWTAPGGRTFWGQQHRRQRDGTPPTRAGP